MTGVVDKATKRGDRYRMRIDPETVELDLVDRRLLRVEVLAAHRELPEGIQARSVAGLGLRDISMPPASDYPAAGAERPPPVGLAHV